MERTNQCFHYTAFFLRSNLDDEIDEMQNLQDRYISENDVEHNTPENRLW